MNSIFLSLTHGLLLILGILSANVVSAKAELPTRVITLGGSVTEIVYALGRQDLLVGVDQSSLYPAQAQALPSIGYYRAVPSEGVLRLQPDLVIASEQAGPPNALRQLDEMGLRIVKVSDEPSLASLRQRMIQVSTVLGVPERGVALSQAFEMQLAQARLIPVETQRAMMVVMRSGKLLGAGRDTAAAKILELAGLENVLQGQKGYQPVSAEIVSALSPAVIIVTSSSVKALGGMDAVRSTPALRMTPAALEGRMIELDDLLAQGMGPRLPLAIQQIRNGVARAQP